MVVMGAGASYDAVRPDRYESYGDRGEDWRSQPLHRRAPFDQRWRPPLAEELFDDRDGTFGEILAHHNIAVPLVQRLQREIRHGTDIELAMRAVEREARATTLGREQLAELGIYLQDVLLNAEEETLKAAHQMTNHRLWADTLEKWRLAGRDREVVYATFGTTD